jgi:hypothetical protein
VHNTHLQNPIVVVIVQMWLTVYFVTFHSDLTSFVLPESTRVQRRRTGSARAGFDAARKRWSTSHKVSPWKMLKLFCWLLFAWKRFLMSLRVGELKVFFLQWKSVSKKYIYIVHKLIYSWEINLYVLFHT